MCVCVRRRTGVPGAVPAARQRGGLHGRGHALAPGAVRHAPGAGRAGGQARRHARQVSAIQDFFSCLFLELKIYSSSYH